MRENASSGRFYYGWVMLAVSCAALVATSPGQSFLVHKFYDSFTTAFELSSKELTGAYALGTILAALPQTFVGRFSDRLGPRLTIGIIGTLFAVACVLMSQVAGLVSLGFGFLSLRLLGQGALGLVSGHTLALWFERRLSTVEGIRLACFSLGMATLPALVEAGIQGHGWRRTWVFLGAGVAVAVVLPALVVFRNRPEDVGQQLDGGSGGVIGGGRAAAAGPDFTRREASRTRVFWIMASVSFTFGLVFTAIVIHLQPLFGTLGLAKARTAEVMATFAVVSLVATLAGGTVADRVQPRYLFAAAALLLGASCFVLFFARSVSAIHAAFVVLGAGHSVLVVTAGPTFARYFGREHHGEIRGLVATIMVAGTSIGPFAFAVPYDALGRYDEAFLVCGIACMPLALAAWTIRRPQRA